MLSNNPGVIDDVNYGVYIWRDAQGRAVVNDDLEYLLVPARKGDLLKIKMLQEVVRSYGITTGQAEFCAGSRPISHEEWEHQMARQEAGLVPDEYDLGNLIDEYRYQKELDNQ